jgi:hypothetical protein
MVLLVLCILWVGGKGEGSRVFLSYFRILGVEGEGIPSAMGGPQTPKDPYPLGSEETPWHIDFWAVCDR